MRHFLFQPLPVTALSRRMIESALMTGLVMSRRPVLSVSARYRRTLNTVNMAPITVTTKGHL